ncbi:MAG: DUF134 domain-containing protein [Treponema sp.]|nr:DUF134 domain-containing protein [Treponema sp.]
MPRPQRCRCIGALPEFWHFSPKEDKSSGVVTITLCEYETIRLLDYENNTQEECAKKMDIARTTVTAMYDSARKKIADCIINGKELVISGGNYQLSAASFNLPAWLTETHKNNTLYSVGDNIMRIAVTYENGNIFQHFGKTTQFKIYDVVDGKITKSEVIGTNGAGHGALAGVLKVANVDVLICGGIGGGAQNAIKEINVKLYGGVTGNTDDAVNALIAGTLKYNPDVKCDHHGEGHGHGHGEGHHHGEGHSCGGKCHD